MRCDAMRCSAQRHHKALEALEGRGSCHGKGLSIYPPTCQQPRSAGVTSPCTSPRLAPQSSPRPHTSSQQDCSRCTSHHWPPHFIAEHHRLCAGKNWLYKDIAPAPHCPPSPPPLVLAHFPPGLPQTLTLLLFPYLVSRRRRHSQVLSALPSSRTFVSPTIPLLPVSECPSVSALSLRDPALDRRRLELPLSCSRSKIWDLGLGPGTVVTASYLSYRNTAAFIHHPRTPRSCSTLALFSPTCSLPFRLTHL